MKRILLLDGWRGCAIISVLFAHFITASVINFGRFGVELFFVLSGRLMAEILFEKNIPLPEFYSRRASRIIPSLLVFVFFMFIISKFSDQPIKTSQLISAATLTFNYTRFFFGSNQNLEHIWSLCIEEHIYILLGIISLLRKYIKFSVLNVLCTLAVTGITIGAIETILGKKYYDVYWRTDVRGSSILIGSIAYLAREKLYVKFQSISNVPLFLIILSIILNFNLIPDPIKYSIGTIFTACSLILFEKNSTNAQKIFTQSILIEMGCLSYSVYLWQQPFSKIGGPFIYMILYLFLSIAAGIISFYVIEKPARNFLNQKLRKLPS